MEVSPKIHNRHTLTRRIFMQTIAAVGAFTPLSSFPLPIATFEQDFISPPDASRMWTWWFWLSNRVDKRSITADVEAMKTQGIGGVTVYSLSNPGDKETPGPNYMT